MLPLAVLLLASQVMVVVPVAPALATSQPARKQVVLRQVARVPYTDPNPAIDAAGHRRVMAEAHAHRDGRRLSEADFGRMSAEPGTVVLDARSPEMFARLHVRGAVNLPFPDIDIPTLARVLPDKQARVLIYCNNNFTAVGPARFAMQPKTPVLSLNLSTYTALFASGYRNLYELGPQLDPQTTTLPLAGSDAGR